MKGFFKLLTLAAILGLASAVVCARFEVQYKDEIDFYAEEYSLPKTLIYAVIKAESGFDDTAVSNRGAIGLMQVTEETAIWCAEKIGDSSLAARIYEPEVNINIGCFYLNYLSNRYNGSRTSMLAAYNAGAANVDEWLKSTVFSDDGLNIKKCPFKETDMYLKKIMFYEKVYSFLYRG